MKFYFDSSVLVAALVQGHIHYTPAIQALDTMIAHKHQGFMSAHNLAEIYAVLTRTPFTPAIYPGEAWQLLETSILPHLEIVTLSAAEYRGLVHQCAVEGHIGGRVYDFIHVQCARKAKCDRLYTFNVRDFRALVPADFQGRVCAP